MSVPIGKLCVYLRGSLRLGNVGFCQDTVMSGKGQVTGVDRRREVSGPENLCLHVPTYSSSPGECLDPGPEE